MPVFASSFDISNGAVLLRLICGLFFLPHIYFKVVGSPPPALGFFKTAGFKPAVVYMRIALVIESLAAAGLILNIYSRWFALLAVMSLSVAAIAVCFFNRSVRWLWNLNGMEYPIFWALTCLAYSMLR